ncbi:MAG: beta-N-acetylhexosaminidase [Clostridia bacterium]|nr:beta-N-acetylhexosaminidase [Clostridia bacterium]
MKISFSGERKLLSAIELVLDDLGIELAQNDGEYSVTARNTDKKSLSVSIDDSEITVETGLGTAAFLRGLATAIGWARESVTKRSISETPIFDLIAAMVDMSRNAVMKPDTVKLMLRKMALMGFNAFMLYTEDTYEIEGRPYFGYMRGRYTKDELRELDGYALSLGIELIPCIQTLGHLETHLRWRAATPYKDATSTLLVGADETYKLIDDMLDTVAECFTTRRIHIGMDETYDLGKGRYHDLNGYKKQADIYMEHLKRVTDMVRSRGMRPMMWSDMMMEFVTRPGTHCSFGYDTTNEYSEDMKKYIPEGLEQVFWSYDGPNEDYYKTNIENHQKYIGTTPIFAGGIWTWSSYSTLLKRSLNVTVPALDACKRTGVREIIATLWHNGAECSRMTAIAGLAWYADYGYRGYYDEEGMKSCFRYATGESYDTFATLEEVDEPQHYTVPMSRALLYNDPLIPIADKNLVGVEYREYYKNLTAKLLALRVSDEYAPAFDVITKLSSLFENKADFGLRLKDAYDRGDTDTLKEMAEECDVVIEKIRALRLSHKNSWMKYNKPFGWEVFDLRYGGLVMRFETCKDRLAAYISGEIDSIPELEEERLRLDCSDDKSEIRGEQIVWRRYPGYTISII